MFVLCALILEVIEQHSIGDINLWLFRSQPILFRCWCCCGRCFESLTLSNHHSCFFITPVAFEHYLFFVASDLALICVCVNLLIYLRTLFTLSHISFINANSTSNDHMMSTLIKCRSYFYLPSSNGKQSMPIEANHNLVPFQQ